MVKYLTDHISVFASSSNRVYSLFSFYLHILSLGTIKRAIPWNNKKSGFGVENTHESANWNKSHQASCREKLAPLAADALKYLHLGVPPHYPRACVLISTSESRNLFAHHVRSDTFRSVCTTGGATFTSSFTSIGRRHIWIYLMWKYFMNASTGSMLKNTPLLKAACWFVTCS